MAAVAGAILRLARGKKLKDEQDRPLDAAVVAVALLKAVQRALGDTAVVLADGADATADGVDAAPRHINRLNGRHPLPAK